MEKRIEVRFSEVDMMRVVWHGAYLKYLEDAREAFGAKYGLGYDMFMKACTMVPLVEVNVKYRHPVVYGMKPSVRITYVPTDAAKLIFDYEIYDPATGVVCLTARTVQVFMDNEYKLLLYSPAFYTQWKRAMGVE